MEANLTESESEYLRLQQSKITQKSENEAVEKALLRFQQSEKFKNEIEATLAKKRAPKHLRAEEFEEIASKLLKANSSHRNPESVRKQIALLRMRESELENGVNTNLEVL